MHVRIRRAAVIAGVARARRRGRRLAELVVVVSLGAAGLSLAAGPAWASLPAGCSQPGPGPAVTCSEAWNTAGTYTFTAPAGVTTLDVTAAGADGGNSADAGSCAGSASPGGQAAGVEDTDVSVGGYASMALTVVVGAVGSGAVLGAGGAGGSPGGGGAGASGTSCGGGGGGGGGGGADVSSGGGGGGGFDGGGGGGAGDGTSVANFGGGGGGGGSSYGVTGLTYNEGIAGTASVTIRYTLPDTVSLAQPGNITVDATNPAGATVSYANPAATDALGLATPSVTCDPAPGSTFPVGATTVTCTATDPDATPNSVSVQFTVTVVPVSVLSLAQPADITTDATGSHGSTVAYPVPAVSDPANPHPPTAICTPVSGSVFAIGITTVTCTAQDSSAVPAQVSVSFTVTVKGAAAQLADLYQSVQGVSHGTLLARTIAQAQAELAAGHPALASFTLDLFIFAVDVLQAAHAFPAATAQALIMDAHRIIVVQGFRM